MICQIIAPRDPTRNAKRAGAMPVFMFWNTRGNAVGPLIGRACREQGVDVLILAENSLSSRELLTSLNDHGEFRFFSFNQVASSVSFFARLPRESIHPVFDDGRVAIRRIAPPLGPEILVTACHLPSKLHRDTEDQYYRARILRRQITNAEVQVGHRNSLIIGDFNMNPFEAGMIAADGLHAVMDKRLVERSARTIQGESWDYFYNPMWSRLGDESEGPSGTYYYSASHLLSYYWNTFDQVLLRPSLLPYYDSKRLSILSQIGDTSLLGSSGPIASISDHLPIILRLNTELGDKNGGKFLENP
jgi:hypothetical protein